MTTNKELNNLVKECLKTDAKILRFEKALEDLRNFKDKSNSVRLSLVLDMTKDFQTSKQIFAGDYE